MQVSKVRSHLIESARDNIAERYDLQHFESAAERWELIDSLLADTQYHFLVAKRVEGAVCSPKSRWKESKAANKWQTSTSLPCRINPAVYLHLMLLLNEYPQKVC
jgi:hypothetical protein